MTSLPACRLLVFALLALSLSSCAVYESSVASNPELTDPNFWALWNEAESNPAPDAIVGMWHRKQTASGSVETHWNSELIKADGTGIRAVFAKESGTDSATPLSWSYSSPGTWTMQYNDRQGEYRLSRGKLLNSWAGWCLV